MGCFYYRVEQMSLCDFASNIGIYKTDNELNT